MINTILDHKTIRKFKTEGIQDDMLNQILEAGTRASTTGNMQVYSMIVTKSPDVKSKLLTAHFNQQMVIQAPVIITFCADFNRFNLWCELRDAKPGYDNFLSFYTASIDALLAAQNVALAAEDFGLGICYLGTTTYMAGKIIEILELPEFVVPVTTIVMGYPDETPGLTDRLPLAGIVHNEKYVNYTAFDIDNLYREKESLESTKALLEENNKTTLAQIFTDNRYTKKDNVAFSKSYLDVIRKQGFMNNDGE